MKRRRKWKAPNNPTAQARIIWRAIYDEPWPKGWRVEWAGFMRNTRGLCIHGERRILLSYADANGKPERTIQQGYSREVLSGDLERPVINVFYTGPVTIPAIPSRLLHTLVHEFTHVRNPKLRHGKEFIRLVEWGWNRLQEVSL